jgi:gamma-glutamyl:cysteine ligase YbdK (ATP-grasp superfamily)
MEYERTELIRRLAKAVEEFAAQSHPDVIAFADVADAAAAISAHAARTIHDHFQHAVDAPDEALTALSDIENAAEKLARAAYLAAQSAIAKQNNSDQNSRNEGG